MSHSKDLRTPPGSPSKLTDTMEALCVVARKEQEEELRRDWSEDLKALTTFFAPVQQARTSVDPFAHLSPLRATPPSPQVCVIGTQAVSQPILIMPLPKQAATDVFLPPRVPRLVAFQKSNNLAETKTLKRSPSRDSLDILTQDSPIDQNKRMKTYPKGILKKETDYHAAPDSDEATAGTPAAEEEEEEDMWC